MLTRHRPPTKSAWYALTAVVVPAVSRGAPARLSACTMPSRRAAPSVTRHRRPPPPAEATPTVKAALTRVEVRSRAEWRAWLEANHGQGESIWLVTCKKHHPDYVSWDAIVEEALCFGWIDSTRRAVDADRTMIRVSPRKKGSVWSRLSKARAARMVAGGKMRPAGQRAIEAAKADGSWTVLDECEALLLPDDLAEALGAVVGARARWDGFPASSKKGILWWIKSAKTSNTRSARIRETARLAGLGLRANFPESKQPRPQNGPPSPTTLRAKRGRGAS